MGMLIYINGAPGVFTKGDRPDTTKKAMSAFANRCPVADIPEAITFPSLAPVKLATNAVVGNWATRTERTAGFVTRDWLTKRRLC